MMSSIEPSAVPNADGCPNLVNEKLRLEIKDLQRWWVKLLIQGLTVVFSVGIAVIGWGYQARIDVNQRRQAEKFHEDEILGADLDRLGSSSPAERSSAAFSLGPFAITAEAAGTENRYGAVAIRGLLEQLHFETQNRVVYAISSAIESVGKNAVPYLHEANQHAAESLTDAVAKHTVIVALANLPGRKPEAESAFLEQALLSQNQRNFPKAEQQAVKLRDDTLQSMAERIREVAFSGVEWIGPHGAPNFLLIWHSTLRQVMDSGLHRAIGELSAETPRDLERIDKGLLIEVDRRARELAALDSTIKDVVTVAKVLPNVDLSNSVLLGMNLQGNIALPNADFHGSYIMGETYEAKLDCANFNGSNISNLDLPQADLRGATFRGTVGLHPRKSTKLGGNFTKSDCARLAPFPTTAPTAQS